MAPNEFYVAASGSVLRNSFASCKRYRPRLFHWLAGNWDEVNFAFDTTYTGQMQIVVAPDGPKPIVYLTYARFTSSLTCAVFVMGEGLSRIEGNALVSLTGIPIDASFTGSSMRFRSITRSG